MKRIAYLDIIGGISGDMLISAMFDAGMRLDAFQRELTKIVPHDFGIEVTKTSRGSIEATHVDFPTGDEIGPSMGWDDFDACISRSELTESDIDNIHSIFECLKFAESKAHGKPAESSHLHELGTIDTLIDIAGAAIGLRLLGIERLYASPFPASVGMSSSSHGKGASFAPATMVIIQESKIPVRVSGMNPPVGESITPTGAAIVATLASFDAANMCIDTVGYGAGTRDTDTPPNVVGLWLGEACKRSPDFNETAETIGAELQTNTVLIETNLDDMTGEELGFATQKLFDLGALDVWITPIQMKKSRPASMLSTICRSQDLNEIAQGVFENTSTLGIRVRQLDRMVARRETVFVDTRYGPIPVKTKRISGEITRVSPEYDDCVRIANRHGVSLRQVFEAANSAASKLTADLG